MKNTLLNNHILCVGTYLATECSRSLHFTALKNNDMY